MLDSAVVVSFDARQIISYTQKADRLLSEYLMLAANKVEARFPTLFASVVSSTGQSVGFPPEYIDHIIEVGSTVGLDISITSHGITASFDFDAIGTEDELERAYHRKAALTDGGYVEGPYEGEELKYDTPHRQEWWDKRVNQPASWEEKVRIWGASAPEWIFLQYGQTTNPATPPTDLMERLQIGVGNLIEGHVRAAVSSALYAESLQTPIILHDEGVVVSRSEGAKRQRQGYFINKRGKPQHGFIGGHKING